MHYTILPELKNAVRAKKDKVIFPYSKMDLAVLKKLADNGYVKSAEREAAGRKSIIVVKLSRGAISPLNDFKITSKPSRHIYTDYRTLGTVRQGHGLAMLSTSQGIMTGREAKKNRIGGEYLFEIW